MKNETYMKKSEMRDFGIEFATRFLKMQELIEKIIKISDDFVAGEPGLSSMSDVMYLIKEYKQEVE